MANPEPPSDWTFYLWAAMQDVRTLTDMGIWPIRRVRLIGRCSWHGRQELVMETTDLLDDVTKDGYIRCEVCRAGGVDRWCPIQEFLLVPERPLSE